MAYKKKIQIAESGLNEDNEKEAMRKEIADLRKMVESLVKVKSEPKQKEVKEIAPNEYIKVMSLVDCGMNLSTQSKGRGKLFNFTNFGVVKKMLYSELLDVINNHQNFFEAGYFYVLDKRVIETGNYSDMYEKILTKEQIERILENSADAVALFESANPKQQAIITNFLVAKVVEDKPIDFNLISTISRISGVDIVARAKEIKLANEIENK